MKAFKYLAPFLMFGLAYLSFHTTGLACWAGFLSTFGFVPGIELILAPDARNLEAEEESLAKANKWYDRILYVAFVLQFVSLYFFLVSMQEELVWSDRLGRILMMGLLAGIFGINLAHELGHRTNKAEQFLAKCLLLTSLYMHFFIEHNKGHHTHVSTPNDPSSAKYKQSVFAFWFQTFPGTLRSAWKIDAKQTSVFIIVQMLFLALIGWFFGTLVMGCFVLAALIGSIQLETVNYIEHYGLARERVESGRYERVKPHHSWNSNHIMGRLLLFELSRHSDHHFQASRKYQVLRHHEDTPQMPTGYPGMILLALVPPIWFRVMDTQMKRYGVLPKTSEPLSPSI
jgi:alkane 1-monooxygenase